MENQRFTTWKTLIWPDGMMENFLTLRLWKTLFYPGAEFTTIYTKIYHIPQARLLLKDVASLLTLTQ